MLRGGEGAHRLRSSSRAAFLPSTTLSEVYPRGRNCRQGKVRGSLFRVNAALAVRVQGWRPAAADHPTAASPRLVSLRVPDVDVDAVAHPHQLAIVGSNHWVVANLRKWQ